MAEYQAFIKELSNTEVRLDEPMGNHTSFGIGGPADVLLFPNTEEALVDAVTKVRQAGLRHYIIGNGTNVLVRDEGIRGVVISPERLSHVMVEETSLTAGAGAALLKIAAKALDYELTGFAFAAGIPGSVGGAVFMNAGAYGGQMADVVASTRYLDGGGQIREISGAAHQFGYRRSFFSAHPECVILETRIFLSRGERTAILDEMNRLAQKRREKQPLEFKSAGSTFKRPEGQFAGRLIEEAGLKGLRVGDAQVSEKHAGFVINLGKASCRDVLTLVETIKDRVYRTSGILLELEVRVLE